MASRTHERELPTELRARALLERELGQPLSRIPEDPKQRRADYRILGPKPIAIEVKEVTNEEFKALGAALAKQPTSVDSTLLTGRWNVIVERFTLSPTLSPTKQPGRAGTPAVTLRRLPKKITDLFAVLESHGYASFKEDVLFDSTAPADLVAAMWAIHMLTNGAMCMRFDVKDAPPGVDIHLGSGSVRTEDPNTMVERIEVWFDDDKLRSNLCDSLRNEPAGTERHAVLVFDSLVEPEVRAAASHGVDFCPTVPLELPEEIDVLWFMLGPVACRFSPGEGWSAVSAPPVAPPLAPAPICP